MYRFKAKSSKTLLNSSLKFNSRLKFKKDKSTDSHESSQLTENQKDVTDIDQNSQSNSESENTSTSSSKKSKSRIKKFSYTIDNFNIPFENAHLAQATKSSDSKMSISTDESKMPSSTDPTLCVQVWYHPTIRTIGWDKLQVKTTGNCNLDAEFQVAGLLEGKFSHKMVKAMFEGMKKMMEMPKSISEKVYKRINDHQTFIRKNLDELHNKEGFDKIYWAHIQLAMAQLEGILDGYNLVTDESDKMTMLELLFINADGEIMELANAMNENRYFRFKDIEKFRHKHKNFNKYLELSKTQLNDLKSALNPYKNKNHAFRFKEQDIITLNINLMKKQDPELQFQFKESESHCTAVVKLKHDHKNNISDLQIGHSTWDDQNEMIRIQKQYDMNIKGVQVKVNFSSYGGTIQSTDDQQVLNSGMVIVETTMEIINTELYKKIKRADESLPNFLRIQIANLLGNNPQDWVDIFKKHASDTQSSQWIIANMNKVNGRIGSDKLDYNSVIVYEQIVDKNGTQDVSDLLNKHSQFAGQNRPFFLSEQAGQSDAEAQYRNVDQLHLYSNYNNPRAVQIRFLQRQIFNMTDFQHLMRYNNASKKLMRGEKKFSNQQQISPRYDLLDDMSREFGATDSKVTNVELALNMSTYAISGPSFDNSPPYMNTSNYDFMPRLWNFSWVVMNEKNLTRQQSEQP